MPESAPSYFALADDLVARVTAEADAWAVSQLTDPSEPPLPGDPRVALRLLRLRFAARVARELGFHLDRLAEQARAAGASEGAVADARADRTPAELRTEVEGPRDV
jgi:hypothetical protein